MDAFLYFLRGRMDMQSNANSLLTVREVAQWLRVSTATAYSLVKRGALPAMRVGIHGGAIRIRAEDVWDYLANATQTTPWTEKPKPPRVLLKHLRLH